MLRSRRFALAAAAVLLGLSACGDAANSTTAGQSPAVIHIGAGASGGGKVAATAEGGMSDRMMMPYANITYVYEGTYPDLGTTGAAWMLPAGAGVDAAKVAALAELFGVEGDVRQLPADQGGGWMVGAEDYSTANLNVSTDGMASWWYNPAPTNAVKSTGGCVMPVAVEDSAGDTDAAAPDTSVAAPETTLAVPECVDEVPVPPVGVPTKDEAIAATKALLADMGLDADGYEFDVYADEWGASVTAYLLLGGHRSPLSVNVGFGENGAITWASGTLATPQTAAEYPIVSPEAGLARLNDQSGQWGWFGYGGGVAMARGAVEDVAVSPAEATEGGGASGVAGDQAITAPVCDPAADCVIEPMPMEDITVTLTSVRLDLTMVWDEDGTVWLLPAYTYTSTDGGEYSVIAVDESLLDLPEPAPVETVPVETTVPGDTVVVDTSVVPTTATVDPTIPEVVVGMTLDEATKLAEGAGWVLRVSTLDGEGQMLTEDYRETRMNVAVEAGVVTAVEFIG
ncbi:MAG: hypothetical protein RL238_24 [Actinomycetota bacterium]|jgi:hypothetical protein